MQKHANISIFVPHMGCPNMCSFCNQRYITKTAEIPNEQTIEDAVNVAKNSPNYNPQNTEIAFFGGSFTAIEFTFMERLLKKACEYVKNGEVCGIRISTRPDAISQEILDVLKKYGVTTIELGAQSMSDNVLGAINRGHTSDDVRNAAKLINQNGFTLGLQMMTGLPNSNFSIDMFTASEFVRLKAKQVRIYPTIVLEDTELANSFKKGEYIPQSVEKAASECAQLLKVFDAANIRVIRLGLHTIDTSKFVAGPWHPAFRELCESQIMLKQAISKLENMPQGNYNIHVNKSNVSKMIGQSKANINKLLALGYNCRVLADEKVDNNEITITR